MLLGEKLEGGRRIDPSNGLIMPWYTSPCLEWLVTLGLKGKRVFEYGVGDSTLWYRSKGAVVSGIDSNPEWILHVGLSNWAGGDKSYTSSILTHDILFDIAVIDGDYRDECTEYALKSLKPGGFLIIDNYKQASADLDHWPKTEKLIEGMEVTYFKEPEHDDWVTIIVKK